MPYSVQSKIAHHSNKVLICPAYINYEWPVKAVKYHTSQGIGSSLKIDKFLSLMRLF